MTVSPIPDPDHIARYVRARLVQRDAGKIVGCFPQAFQLREATATRPAETYLSASWLEFFAGTCAEQLAATSEEIKTYLTVKPQDALAVCNVAKLKETGQTRNSKIRVLHEPKPTAKAYAAIRGTSRDDTQLLGLLAAEAVAEMVEIAALGR